MRAFEAEVFDAVWAAVEPLLHEPPRTHPLGCHRPRIADRVCFRGILIRLVTGCSWVDVEAILDHQVSDTTLRHRRDEWIHAGVFDHLAAEALAAHDRIIGLDLTEVAIDGSHHKAPCGGEGTGPNCTDKGRHGWKWSLATDTAGIPVGVIAAPANRNDCKLVAATLDDIGRAGLLEASQPASQAPATLWPSANPGKGPLPSGFGGPAMPRTSGAVATVHSVHVSQRL